VRIKFVTFLHWPKLELIASKLEAKTLVANITRSSTELGMTKYSICIHIFI